MSHHVSSRRQFLARVGQVMVVAGVGASAARDMGLSPAWGGEEGPSRISFGARDRLVDLIQTSTAEQILPRMLDVLKSGTELREIVAAAALANARGFGGEDYIGFHTFMALMPALQMARQMPSDQQALPVLKVLYRNCSRLAAAGKNDDDTLEPVTPAAEVPSGDRIRQEIRKRELAAAEQSLAAAARVSAEDAWDNVLPALHDGAEVHRVVLAHRSWDMLGLVGSEYAGTLLRQSLHYFNKSEEHTAKHFGSMREILPKVMNAHQLDGITLGTRIADEGWILRFSETLFTSTPEQAADAVGAALAEGIAPDSISDAISLATNQLLLRDAGRTPGQVQPGKGPGSVHGDSIGVHACDSANAWRSIARVSRPRNAAASLVLAGWQAAQDRSHRAQDFLTWTPRPTDEQLKGVTSSAPDMLLKELDGAIRENNQERACALAQRYSDLGHDSQRVFDTLRAYAISEDGALHAEKFYWTTTQEYALSRPAFRSRYLVGLARVSASAYGNPAPGLEEAQRLLTRG